MPKSCRKCHEWAVILYPRKAVFALPLCNLLFFFWVGPWPSAKIYIPEAASITFYSEHANGQLGK